MPRSSRLDAPGVLHHVMGRGIERRKIFIDKRDRQDFITCLTALAEDSSMDIYAWALLPTFPLAMQNQEAAIVIEYA